jgi:hypothetical protein
MRRLAAACIALALGGCVTAKTTMLDDRTAIITARGTAWDDQGGVARKIFVEAATLAKSRGYELFEIIGAADASRSGVVYNPGRSTSNTYGGATCSGYSCYGSATTNTTSTPATAIPYVRPGADVAIRFWHAGEAPEGARLISADAVLSSK